MRHATRTLVLRLGLVSGLALSSALAGATVAHAATPGQVCLFNAPSGAATFGHVGWGFRNGTADNWTFGATEDQGGSPIVGPGDGAKAASQSWDTTGTLAQMLQDFGSGTLNGQYSDLTGYYEMYRCADVANSNPSAASTEVGQVEKSGYNFFLDNCLTKAIGIFGSYGITLPPGPSTPPNFYFTNELGSLNGFGPIQYLTTVTIRAQLVDALNHAYLNASPVHQQRPMTIRFYNAASGNTTETMTASLVTNTSTNDMYQVTFQVPYIALPGNDLILPIQVQLNNTIFTFTPGETFPGAPGPAVLLIPGVGNTPSITLLTVGDVNGDGEVNLQDYNLLLQCFSDLQPPRGPCSASLKVAADLNDDGSVNGIDYNEMLRIFSSQRQ